MRITHLEQLARELTGRDVVVSLGVTGSRYLGMARNVGRGMLIIELHPDQSPAEMTDTFYHEIAHIVAGHIDHDSPTRHLPTAHKEQTARELAKWLSDRLGPIEMKTDDHLWIEQTVQRYARRPTQVVLKNFYDGTTSNAGTFDGLNWIIELDNSLLGNRKALREDLFFNLGRVAIADQTGVDYYGALQWARAHMPTEEVVPLSLKSVSIDDEGLRMAGYLVQWNGAFSKSTSFDSGYIRAMQKLPIVAPTITGDDAPIGVVDWKTAIRDERGLFVERVLSRRNKYIDAIKRLIESGALVSSLQTAGQIVTGANGKISSYPICSEMLSPL